MKLLIIDDHTLFREGLRLVLNALDEELLIFEASNYDDALTIVADNLDLDLALLDLNLPGKNGFNALDSITESNPVLPVIIVSASNHNSDIQQALNAGAMGYIPKDTSSEVMLSAIKLVLSGGIYAPHQSQPESSSVTTDTIKSALTPRQLEVLTLLSQGLSNKVIGQQMELAEATVKMHISAIFKTLKVNNRTQAAIAAEKLGVLDIKP